MPRVVDRALTALNLKQYDELNRPDKVGKLSLRLPKENVYILRMLIYKQFNGGYKLPLELSWLQPLLLRAVYYQMSSIGVKHPFCYLTIRKGPVTSVTDDEWHVDGFSQTVTHLPEQNYIWVDDTPTEYLNGFPIKIPNDFNPNRHNIHKFFQKEINEYNGALPIQYIEPKTLYCMDPYIIHRRPTISNNSLDRTFVRLSFTPIEIEDVNNTPNPLIPTNYTRDGVKVMRDKLKNYPD